MALILLRLVDPNIQALPKKLFNSLRVDNSIPEGSLTINFQKFGFKMSLFMEITGNSNENIFLEINMPI